MRPAARFISDCLHGYSWSTHWFRLEVEIPEEWAGEYVVLRWDSTSEAMVWQNGSPLQVSHSSSSTHNTDAMLPFRWNSSLYPLAKNKNNGPLCCQSGPLPCTLGRYVVFLSMLQVQLIHSQTVWPSYI